MCYTTNLIQNKIAVSLWLYHIDLWDEIFSLIKPYNKYIKLYLGLYKNANYTKILEDLNTIDDSVISFYDNYGADIAPFLFDLRKISEPYVIKIHTKKSILGINNHINWRNVLLHSFFGNESIFLNNLSKIQDSNIGMICNKNLCFHNRPSIHSEKINTLCKHIGIDYDKASNSRFSAGTMFMMKTSILHKYLTNESITYICNKLKKEQGKVEENRNGTYSHAMERVFGCMIKDSDSIIDFPIYDMIKIFNKETEQYYHLIIMHNNDCYLYEDLNVYGKIFKINNSYEILWQHINKSHTTIYQLIEDKIITKL